MTCKLMIWDPNDHVPILDLPKCVFNGKNIIQPHWVVCTITSLKGGQTFPFD
jgi:hypothetical protein